MEGPKAPKDPVAKKSSFFIMRQKQIAGGAQSDGRGIQFIYLNDVRLTTFARMVGNITDEAVIEMLRTAEGFRKLVAGIGVTLEAPERDQTIDFVFQMYGRKDPNHSGTLLRVPMKPDGMEQILWLDDYEWSEDDNVPGQIRFEFDRAEKLATVDVRLYLRDGYHVPEPEEYFKVDTGSPEYDRMIKASLIQTGNTSRLKKAIERARRGEDVTMAFIGGSITQGAGAIPIHTQCYAYKTYQEFCRFTGSAEDTQGGNVRFIKAGVGGTPSELGMVRFERDVLRDGSVTPDIVVVEFAVNDEGDETKGECYESLVRKILALPGQPAVILFFLVFANDWNLQERLVPIGRAYDLPMVSMRDAVVDQFRLRHGEGRVLSKSQYFYDCYHPTNTGYSIMTDCLMHLIRQADEHKAEKDTDWEQVAPVYGNAFEKIRLLDRHTNVDKATVECGSFSSVDATLQSVEMDRNFAPTPQFPYNWMHESGDEPFRMRIVCRSLVLVHKDSGEINVGRARVFVDGKEVLTADPHDNGWTHCNPRILFRNQPCTEHLVEITMAPGDEDKKFTILGFGYVE